MNVVQFTPQEPHFAEQTVGTAVPSHREAIVEAMQPTHTTGACLLRSVCPSERTRCSHTRCLMRDTRSSDRTRCTSTRCHPLGAPAPAVTCTAPVPAQVTAHVTAALVVANAAPATVRAAPAPVVAVPVTGHLVPARGVTHTAPAPMYHHEKIVEEIRPAPQGTLNTAHRGPSATDQRGTRVSTSSSDSISHSRT